MKEKLITILEHYGARHQSKKLMEETAELVEALQVYMDTKSAEALDDVTEEIADCYVVAKQLALAFIEFEKINERYNQAMDECGKFGGARIIDVLTALNTEIIIRVVHYEYTNDNVDALQTAIFDYVVALSRLTARLDINAASIRSIMEKKIERQIKRIDAEILKD